MNSPITIINKNAITSVPNAEEGLLGSERAAALPNNCTEYYPEQKFGDFSVDYDADRSAHPWNTIGNCIMCGRLEVCEN